MPLQYDERKNLINIRKHHISIPELATMYYIVAGEEICYAVRGPKEIADEVLNQEIYIRAFNYDDEEIWSDEALDLERERVLEMSMLLLLLMRNRTGEP